MMRLHNEDDVAYTADLHLGDKHHAQRMGHSVITWADKVIAAINSQITEKTVLIMVGDIICDVGAMVYLEKIKCKKIICILGNRESRNIEIVKAIANGGWGGYSSIRVGVNLVTHIPPHAEEAQKYHRVIHGHFHNDFIYHHKYNNVSWSMTKGNVARISDLIDDE